MSKIVDRIFNTVLTADDPTAQEELGSLRFEDGKIYKYVQFQDNVSAAAGAPVLMDGTYNYKVTVDYTSAAETNAALVCGVALTTNTEGYYGWIQTYGVGTVTLSDAVSGGDLLVHSGTDLLWKQGVLTDSTRAIVLENNDVSVTSAATALIMCM